MKQNTNLLQHITISNRWQSQRWGTWKIHKCICQKIQQLHRN